MSWIAHPLAGVLIALFACLIWTRDARSNRVLIALAAVLTALVFLGAPWAAHPAAGLSLAAYIAFGGITGMLKGRVQSTRALAGMALFGAIGAHWVFIPAAVFTVLSVAGGFGPGRDRARERDRHGRRAKAVNASTFSAPQPQIERQSAQIVPLPVLAADPRFPDEARRKALALNTGCFEALDYLRSHQAAGSGMVFEVEQIQRDFAPTALRSYLALAPGKADSQPLADGKTGRDLLLEQLDMLQRALDKIMDRAGTLGSEQILSNQRFLSAKYGDRPQDLQL